MQHIRVRRSGAPSRLNGGRYAKPIGAGHGARSGATLGDVLEVASDCRCRCGSRALARQSRIRGGDVADRSIPVAT